MCRAYGSLIAGFLRYNGLKSFVTKQKQAYGLQKISNDAAQYNYNELPGFTELRIVIQFLITDNKRIHSYFIFFQQPMIFLPDCPYQLLIIKNNYAQ